MKKVNFYIILIAIISSCSNDDNQRTETQTPQIPESVGYDFNQDSIDDFTIEYREGIWDGVGASGGVFNAYLEPIGENKVLEEYEENVSTTTLFAKQGDSIKLTVNSPQSWGYFGRMASLWQNGDGIWSKKWEIESKKETGPYYVGVQIQENNLILLGWLKVEIDKKTGKIDIVDQDLASENFIVIDR